MVAERLQAATAGLTPPYAVVDLAQDDQLRESIMVMVDSIELCELIADPAGNQPIKVFMDLDAPLRVGPLQSCSTTRRSQACRTAPPAVRTVKRLSARELHARRREVIVAVRNLADLKLINGGGSGSLHIVSSDHQLTGPTLFDHYRGFTPTLAASFVSPVVRKPSPRHAVVYSGGYIASGPPGWSREPPPWVPRQLRLCERFDRSHLVQGDRIIDEVPTYRGEGWNFG